MIFTLLEPDYFLLNNILLNKTEKMFQLYLNL